MSTFMFTAFSESDLVGSNHVARHVTFTMPDAATLDVTVTDDDHFLSGDARWNEIGDDRSGQTASILRDGAEIGNGKTLYAEKVWRLDGSDGEHYLLAELEQPGFLEDNFTFVGAVPPSGVELTVTSSYNVRGHGIEYSKLSAGSAAATLPNIVEIATGSDDFNILVKALSTAGLVETVQNADDITVFAPTDAAFIALAVDLGYGGDTADEHAVFDFIAGQLAALNNGDAVSLLTDILFYHVSPGAKTAAEVDAADQIVTLLTDTTFGSEGTELTDNEPDVANPNIVIPDVPASNGTVQVIDRVLLPIDIPGNEPADPPAPMETIAGLVAMSGGTFDGDNTDFDMLLAAVQTAGLAGALDDPDADLTVFAPTDAAFIGLAQALGFGGDDEAGAFAYLVEALSLLGGGNPIPLLTEVLTYHVSPGAKDATAVLGSTTIETLQGGSLGVNGTMLVDADPDVADPSIVATNLPASNGIVHVLDGVLLPADLLQSDGSNKVDFVIDDDAGSLIKVARDNDFVDGNGGDDRIFLGRGDDVGFGGAGNDFINGGAGNDTIVGGEGDDSLFGGNGLDVFVFAAGDGHDRITRFEKGEDKIDLSAFGFADFADIADHIDHLANGAKIDLDGQLSIRLHFNGAPLDEGDFIF